MKYKYIIAIYLTGSAVEILGAFFKIIHWPGAGTLSSSIKVAAVVGGIIKILKDNDAKSFFNR